MRGQGKSEDEHEQNTGSGQRGPAVRWSRRRWALLIRAVLGVAVVGLPALAVVFRGRGPEDRSKLEIFASSAPPEVAALVGEAAGVADRLVERFPDDPDSLNVLAWVHFRFGGSDEAVGYWQTCLELNPGFVDAYFSMGSAARDSGDHEKAAECFRKAWELDPGWPSLAEHLAQALMNQGEMEEAIEVLEKNLEAHPKSTRSLTLVGDICVQLKEHEKAKQSYEAAIEISPDSTSAYYGAANACATLGDTEKSKEYMEKFKALKGRGEEAYRDALKTDDDVLFVRWGVAETCMAAGKVYLAHGDPQTAEAHFRRGADLCPTHPECLPLLAWLYEQQGRTDEAIAAWLEAKKSDPEKMSGSGKIK